MKDSRQSPAAGKASSPWALRMKACVSPSNAKGKCFTFPRGFFHLSARLALTMRTSQTPLLAPPSAPQVLSPRHHYSPATKRTTLLLRLRYMRGSFLMDQSFPLEGRRLVASVSRFGSFTLLLLAVVGLFAAVKPVRACAQENILPNGNLTLGKDAPDSWSTQAWQRGADFTTFHWKHTAGAPGEVEISSLKPNDTSWVQKLHLGPGWYHFTTSMRTEGVPTGNTGAYISILEDGIVSDFLYGTNNWRELGFYLKVGEAGADVELACRVGGFASLNTGKAACRDFRGVKIDAPPED